MPRVLNTLIELDEHGVAWVSGTKIKVIEVVTNQLAHGIRPEEMRFHYPHLSLAQVHAALAYYYQHQAEFDAEIIRQANWAAEMDEIAKDSPLRLRLKGRPRENN
jgi:uncharacterized protein (DUF433 family)